MNQEQLGNLLVLVGSKKKIICKPFKKNTAVFELKKYLKKIIVFATCQVE